VSGARPGWAVVALVGSVAGALTGAGLGGCGIAPWSMGQPLNGRPSIPSTTQAPPSVAKLRVRARDERAVGHTVLELRALHAISDADRLTPDERARLASLLEQRATELMSMRRAVPACADLRLLEQLVPARARALASVHARAERDAGDDWLAVGDGKRAHAAYQIAAYLGADTIDIRLAAADGQALPSDLAPGVAERAILELPLRAVPAFATVYLNHRDGPLNRAALERARRAARQEKRSALVIRLDQALAQLDGPGAAGTPATPSASNGELPPSLDTSSNTSSNASSNTSSDVAWEQAAEALLDAPAAPRASVSASASMSASMSAPLAADPAALERWVLGSASASFRLLPMLQRTPLLLAPDPRGRAWGELLLQEDPTSPDVLEIAAVIDGLADRIGGAERKLTDLVYFTPDRYQGMVRAAQIWRRVGQARLSCVAWVRAARWQDDVDDPAWRHAIDCTRGDPGAGDWRAIRQYILDRAPAGRRDAIAAALDAAPSDPARAPLSAPPVSARPAGDPIPCDTGGSPR
jgi:hypothetical protein